MEVILLSVKTYFILISSFVQIKLKFIKDINQN